MSYLLALSGLSPRCTNGSSSKWGLEIDSEFISGKSQLYNFDADISEAMDISRIYPEKSVELLTLLKAWQKEVKAEFPVPNPEFDAEKRYEWEKYPDRKKDCHVFVHIILSNKKIAIRKLSDGYFFVV